MTGGQKQFEADRHLHQATQHIEDIAYFLGVMKKNLSRLNGKNTTVNQAAQYCGELAALLRITDVVAEHQSLKAKKGQTHAD